MNSVRWLGLVCSAMLLLSCGNRTNDAAPGKLLPPQDGKIYFGAFPDFGGPEDNVTTQRIEDFEAIAGKKIAWAYFSQNWYNGIRYPKQAIDAIAAGGSVPFVRLMPRSNEEQGHAETCFSLQHIIDGDFDQALKEWAQEARRDSIPLLVDFAVEANGDWFPWSGVFNGGGTTDLYGDPDYPDGPERYRDAYRHIIDLFRQEGAANITWFFHFNYASFPQNDWNRPKYYYPGDDYIDWIGFSLYGAQTLDEEWEGLEFSTQLQEHVQNFIEIGSVKPVALLEFGVTDQHPDGNKSHWLEDAFATITTNPYITFSAISPWHETWENEDETLSTIRLDSSPSAQKTFQTLISDDRYISSCSFRR